MPGRQELIWIEDVKQEYGRGRTWLDEQVKAGRLHVFKMEGDKKVYLSRVELDDLLAPRQVRREEDAG